MNFYRFIIRSKKKNEDKDNYDVSEPSKYRYVFICFMHLTGWMNTCIFFF